MMRVIALHISHCVNADKTSDKCDDDAHKDRKPVHHHVWPFFHLHGEFCVQYDRCLYNRQNDRQHFPVLHTQIDDQAHQENIPRRHQVIDQFCLRIQHPYVCPAGNPADDKNNRGEHNNTGTCIDDIPSCFLISDQLEKHRQHCRNSDQ